MQKQAVIIYGPPGSGKGTQADLLVRRFGFVHFDTGRFLENTLRAPGWQKDPVLRRERELFDSGKLCTPSWVLKIVLEATERIARAGLSVVYSGSPRTLFEAFGDGKHEGFFTALSKWYGKRNVRVVKLNVHFSSSAKRNSARLVCSVCGLPLLAHAKLHTCAFCAGKMRKRTLDDQKVIRVRLKEYEERTFPILRMAKRNGFRVNSVNGEPPPYKVHASIVKLLKLARG